MSKRFSIITTCKGRLHNLKQALPSFVRQKYAEVIVVDYDCPDGTAAWVAAEHPGVRVVSVKDRPKFNTSHARNLGAAVATGKFLGFLDADVVIAPDFTKYLDETMKGHCFGTFGGEVRSSLRGSFVVWREDFERIRGYDELLGGYNGEDLEMYMRLRLIDSREVDLDPKYVVEMIEQTLEERERFRAPDIRLQFLRGQLYMLIKEMTMTVGEVPGLDRDTCQRLLDDVNRDLQGLYEGTKDVVVEVELPDKYNRGYLQDWEFTRKLTVTARKRQKPG